MTPFHLVLNGRWNTNAKVPNVVLKQSQPKDTISMRKGIRRAPEGCAIWRLSGRKSCHITFQCAMKYGKL